MALVKCPECGRVNVADNPEVCSNCGYGLKEHFEQSNQGENIDEKNPKKYFDKKTIYIIIFLVILVIAYFCYDNIKKNEYKSRAVEIENLVEENKFNEALEILDSNVKPYIKEETNKKIQVIGGMERFYKDAQSSSTNDMKKYNYMIVVLESIGEHQQILDWGLYDYTEKMVLDSLNKIENMRDKIFDDTISEIIYAEYNDKENSWVEPYRTDNPEGAKKYINYLVSSINQVSPEKYKEEQYNKNNPIQITKHNVKKEDGYWYCTGTVSNISNESHSYVKIKVTYYDDKEEVLTTDWGYAVDSVGIKSGENQQFELMTKVRGDVEGYRVEIVEFQ